MSKTKFRSRNKKKTYPIPIVNNDVFSIFTDGSCLDNNSEGGPGGLAYIGIYNGKEYSSSLGFYKTTNNRMELLATIKPLEELQEPTRVVIYTDSQYTINCVTLWHFAWRKRGWVNKEGNPVLNIDLIKRLLSLMSIHKVTFIKVKAHIGIKYNEIVDELAKLAANNPTEIDYGFIPKSKRE